MNKIDATKTETLKQEFLAGATLRELADRHGPVMLPEDRARLLDVPSEADIAMAREKLARLIAAKIESEASEKEISNDL